MSWKDWQDSDVTSGRWPNGGGSRGADLWEALRARRGAFVEPELGVSTLSLRDLAPSRGVAGKGEAPLGASGVGRERPAAPSGSAPLTAPSSSFILLMLSIACSSSSI